MAILGDMETADQMYEAMLSETVVGDVIEQGNMITLHCRTCGYIPGAGSASLDHDRLVTLDPRMTLKALTERAVFRTCGHRGAWLDMRRDPRAIPKPPSPHDPS